MRYIVDEAHTCHMFELMPLLAISAVAIVSTVYVTSRDGYRRVPRKH